MLLRNVKTNERIPAGIELLSLKELKSVAKNKEECKFKWQLEKDYEIYKLFRLDTDEMLGLMSIQYVPHALAIKIRLLESGKSNVGSTKQIDGIAGCLISWACRLSFINGFHGSIYLIAKSELIECYKKKYGMRQLGKTQTCEIEQEQAKKLINEFLSE
ncbi:MAG: hypothetical protein M3R17_09645 [Bacteroidota bacterium]|nr:hypothetical protein [Bacteroidota bacterium]